MKRSHGVNSVAPLVLSYFQQGCLVLAINRPDHSNAWSTAISMEIAEKLLQVESNPAAKAVVITGTGDLAFSVGQVVDQDASLPYLVRCYETIRSFSKPIVAAVNGDADGVGFCITQLCDVAIGHPNVEIGFKPTGCGTQGAFGAWLLWERIGRRAVEPLLHGRLFTASEAQHLGLLHQVVDSDSLIHDSVEVALRLSSKPPLAYSLSKKAIRSMTEDRYANALLQEAGLYTPPAWAERQVTH